MGTLKENANLNLSIFKNFVSMGPHCCIRLRINDKLSAAGVSYGETGMFDYNICNTDTLKKMISNCDISEYFNESNIEYKKTNETNGFAHVNLKNTNFKSIHDVPNCTGDTLSYEIKKYIEKYKRRHQRMINLIKSNRKIVFVYMEKMTYEDVKSIKDNIGLMTRKKIPIISLHDFGKDEPLISELDGNFLVNYANLYVCEKDCIKKTNWIKMEFLDWDSIFKALEKVYLSFRTKIFL